METVKNLIVICQWQDGAYNCTVDLWDSWTQTWDENVPYCARAGDPAPVNVWILEQIATGAYDPIDACPIPPPPPEPTQPSGQDGPTVL
jgi:hypothetical protein